MSPAKLSRRALMSCAAAATSATGASSPIAASTSDAEPAEIVGSSHAEMRLLELWSEFRRREAAYAAYDVREGAIEAAAPQPAELIHRHEDAAMVKAFGLFVPPAGLDHFWPTHVATLRNRMSSPDLDERISARVREIVAASDRWDECVTRTCAEMGLRPVDDEQGAVLDGVDEIAYAIRDVRADTMLGLCIKARAACWNAPDEYDPSPGDAHEVGVESLLADLLRISEVRLGTGSPAVSSVSSSA